MSVQTRKLRGVCVGAGYFSAVHLDAWRRIPEVELSAVADLDLERARRAASRFGIARAYEDYREMLQREQPDFVDVITRPDSHLEICTEAAREGVHIVCQKPLALTYEEAERLVEKVAAAGVRFMVHENWRWQPWYREVRKLGDGGVLGEIFCITFCMRTGDGWKEDAYQDRQPYFRGYPRLLMYETGVHFVDTFRYLLGEITSVSARLRRLNPAIAGEDSGVVVFGFESGATAVLDANRYNEPETDDDPRYTFGTMRVDAARGHLRLLPDGRMILKPLGEASFEHPYEHVDRGLGGDCTYHLQRHFVERLTSGGAFESSGQDYLRTLRAVEACYTSAAEGRVVTLPAEQSEAFVSVRRAAG
jgi:D-apiose dehydrogenase